MALLADLQTTLEGYARALAEDSANPKPTYELNGKKVQRNEWRKGLMEAMVGVVAQINGARPYWIETRFRT